MKTRTATRIAALVIVFALPAYAQQTSPVTEKLEFRKWDVGGTFGLVGSPPDFSGVRKAGHAELGLIGNIDVGRYFTPHLKVEAGLMRTNERSFSQSAGGPGFFGYTHGKVQPTSVSGALTYQFFKNAFGHPYVSAGIRVTSLSEEWETVVFTPNFVRSTVSPGSRRFTQALPFVPSDTSRTSMNGLT